MKHKALMGQNENLRRLFAYVLPLLEYSGEHLCPRRRWDRETAPRWGRREGAEGQGCTPVHSALRPRTGAHSSLASHPGRWLRSDLARGCCV